jgi:hypothetical protein
VRLYRTRRRHRVRHRFLFAETEGPVIGGTGVGNVELTDLDGSFEAALNGLSAGTTYFYRAYATTDGGGTAYSAEGQFTTVAQPARAIPCRSLPARR